MSQGHGRHETRQVFPYAVTPEQTGFAHAAQAALVLRTTHHLKSCKVSEELEIVLSSRSNSRLDASQIQAARRGHWGIESVHHVRDVSLGEDASTVRTGHAPQNLAALRNLLIGLCGLEGARKGKRSSSLPSFRRYAQNHRAVAVALVACPLLEAG